MALFKYALLPDAVHRSATAFNTHMLDANVVEDIKILYEKGLHPKLDEARASRLRTYLFAVGNYGESWSSYGALEKAWDERTGYFDPARHGRLVTIVECIERLDDRAKRQVLSGVPLRAIIGPIPESVKDRPASLSAFDQLLAAYCIMAQTWRLSALARWEQRLDGLADFVSNVLRFAPTPPILVALAVLLGTENDADRLRALLKCGGTTETAENIHTKSRSAAWDLFLISALDGWNGIDKARALMGPLDPPLVPACLVTGDKRIIELIELVPRAVARDGLSWALPVGRFYDSERYARIGRWFEQVNFEVSERGIVHRPDDRHVDETIDRASDYLRDIGVESWDKQIELFRAERARMPRDGTE